MEAAGEFRIALTVDDFDRSLSFYRDVLGLPVKQEWPSQEGRGVLLGLPDATLELIDAAHAAWVDDMEVGRRVSGRLRFALRFSNLQPVIAAAVRAGAHLVHEPIETPWRDENARILGPDGLQMTFFRTPPKTAGPQG